MKDGRIVLPTAVRMKEETAEGGGWSRFFDAALASIEPNEVTEFVTRLLLVELDD